MNSTVATAQEARTGARRQRALAIARAGGLEQALVTGALPRYVDTTLSEALVLGLLRNPGADNLILINDTERYYVHQAVVVVALVEDNIATQIGHADGISVTPDAVNNAADYRAGTPPELARRVAET